MPIGSTGTRTRPTCAIISVYQAQKYIGTAYVPLSFYFTVPAGVVYSSTGASVINTIHKPGFCKSRATHMQLHSFINADPHQDPGCSPR